MNEQRQTRTRVGNRRTDEPEPGDVYIGRPSRWGNPFPLENGAGRNSVITAYRNRLVADLTDGRMTRGELAALAGKRLMCWCHPQACHGHVLAVAADWAAGSEPLADAPWVRDRLDGNGRLAAGATNQTT